MEKDNYNSVYYSLIAIWLMIGGMAQCESEKNLDDIRQELRGIKHELNMMRYK